MEEEKNIDKDVLQKMKAEAEERIKSLGLNNTIERLWNKDGMIMCSDNRGCIRNLNYPEYLQVKIWEVTHKALAYHAVYSESEVGSMLALLFVSNCPEQWKDEREELQGEEKCVHCYVMNLDDDELLSEYGDCWFTVERGILLRIG